MVHLTQKLLAFVDLESRTLDHGQSALKKSMTRSIDRIVGPPSDLVSIDSVLINDIGSLSSSIVGLTGFHSISSAGRNWFYQRKLCSINSKVINQDFSMRILIISVVKNS